ncbi:MAG TPA: RDD family protein [Planctomycetaceae bacterium]|jgi:uncharacterized RDD family membrane protein YckC|nr:RDD family protein [Planctomycetaceae bacterium]
MASPLEFETPENVQIAYRPAGLGTRFSAWMLDTVFVLLVSIAVFVFAMVVASATGVAWKRFENLDPANEKDARQISLYFFAFAWLFWGLGSFLYFTLCELLGRGQTIGKRASRVRVVKSDGFSLDAASILLRNVFRLVDQLPALWIVPVLSPRSQRFGDMVAGTIVVSEAREDLGELRTALLRRPAAESKFRFDGTMLARALPVDIEAAERILERWADIAPRQRFELLELISDPLARRLGTSPPDVDDRREFLAEFLAAVYRREARRLG